MFQSDIVEILTETGDVRFGSQADICAATSDVRYTPDIDCESRHPKIAMSALALKADVCGATGDVG